MTDHPLTEDERTKASEYLREHMLTGRLPEDQYRSRVAMLGQLRTAREVDSLFYDLPQPRPAPVAQQWEQPPSSPGHVAPTTSYPEPGTFPPRTSFPRTSSGTGLAPIRQGRGVLANVSSNTWATAMAVLWPLTILVIILTGEPVLFFLPFIATPLIRQAMRAARERERAARGGN